MGNEKLTGMEQFMVAGFVLVVLALFLILIFGLRAIWKDEWKGERRRRGRSWCPRLRNMVEQARVRIKISRFRRDLELHRRRPRGGELPGRHHLGHA